MPRKADQTAPATVGRAKRELLWQTLVVLAVWGYLIGLHWDNDGLWFQGDAPRHAMNGFFWVDYLRDFTPNAKDYALSYYARYPAVDPASRPPVFYLLEGAAYRLLGPSPYVAKGLVLVFSVVAALYLLAWLRQWISAEAGWAAAWLLLVPGMTTWSFAIMLNVPALALGLGALYHARRSLEVPVSRRRDFALAAVMTVLGILTYYPTGVVGVIFASWIAVRRSWSRWRAREVLLAVGVGLLVLLPFTWLIVQWAPVYLGWVLPAAPNVGMLANWTCYPLHLPQMVDPYLLCLAGGGAVASFAQKRWRTEAVVLTSWVLVLYAVFSILHAKDLRYALPVTVPLLIFCTIAIVSVVEWLSRRPGDRDMSGRTLTSAMLLAILAYQGYLAMRHTVPVVSGYGELVSFLERVAPDEPVFYDGYHDGIFTFYVRAGDDRFQRRVVLSSKLLYASAIVPGWR